MTIGWIRTAARAVAGFAAAFVLSCSGLGGIGAAQAAVWQPNEDDALILELHSGQYKLGESLRAYQAPGGICVDMADLIMALDLPVRLDKKSRRATGWIFAENERFTLDRDSNMVQTMNGSKPLAAGTIIDTPEGWCTRVEALSNWFGVTFKPELGTMTLRIVSDRKLPFLEAIERKNRAARLARRTTPEEALATLPHAATPYSSWSTPAVDVLVHSQVQSFKGQRLVTGNYELLASGEVLGASAQVRLASDAREAPQSLRVRLFRNDPSGNLLGGLHATQVAAGDVETVSGSLTGQSAIGRGVFLSNRPIEHPSRFSTTTLRGALPSGWDAELYVNGELRAWAADRGDGRYEFADVELLFGDNQFDVVLYGPQGQIRHDRSSMAVGMSSLPKGQTWYWAGVLQQNRDLIGIDPHALTGLVTGWRWGFGVEHGIDQRTTAGFEFHSLVLADGRKDYVESTVTRSFGSMIAQLSAAQQAGAGEALRAEALGRIAGIGVSGEFQCSIGHFESELVGANQRRQMALRLNALIHLGRWRLPVAGTWRRTVTRDGRVETEWSLRGSKGFGRLQLTTQLIKRTSQGGSGPTNANGTFFDLIGNTMWHGIRLRGESEWRLAGSGDGTQPRGLSSAAFTADAAIGKRDSLRFAYSYDRQNAINQFAFGLVRQFDRFALRGEATYDPHRGPGAAISIAFSLGPDPADGGWRASREPLASTGSAAVEVFRDDNANGIRDPGEGPVEGVSLEAGYHHARAPTNAQGRAVIEGLRPYEPILVAIDTSTLPDPLLQPKVKGLVMVPRPGIAGKLELALTPTGEIEATLLGPDGEVRAGQTVELVDEAGRVVRRVPTEFDGYLLFDSVPYGSYRMRITPRSAAALGASEQIGGALRIDKAHPSLQLGAVKLVAAPQTVVAARH